MALQRRRHGDAAAALDSLFAELDGALRGFLAELRAQDIFDQVAVFTSSDFGRTLTSNGAGTDHGWAGQSAPETAIPPLA